MRVPLLTLLASQLLVRTSGSLYLPYTREDRGEPFSIITHGLGGNHYTCSMVKIDCAALSSIDASYIAYTSRGSGNSSGWQDTAASNVEQFTWERLADDMIELADRQGVKRFIASGYSMGAATALFAAMKHPKRMLGLILMCPPTAWGTRAARREELLELASRRFEKNPNDPYSYVIRGSAISDLPDLADTAAYGRIVCPVLILAVTWSGVHPASTATALHEVLPTSTLVIDDSVSKNWEDHIKDFVTNVRMMNA